MAFNVMAKSEPRGAAKGQFKCEIGKDGLTLTQRKKQEIHLPVGTKATYVGRNRLEVALPEYRVELAVTKFGSFQNRLARDIAAFVNGAGEAPNVGDYSLPWYFYVICVLPIGIPIITLGGVIPAVVGFGLAGACFGIAQLEEWPTPVRMLVSLALVAAGYVILFVLLTVAMGQR